MYEGMNVVHSEDSQSAYHLDHYIGVVVLKVASIPDNSSTATDKTQWFSQRF